MTRIRWSEPATKDFLGVIEWLQARNPAAAARVGRRILDAIETPIPIVIVTDPLSIWTAHGSGQRPARGQAAADHPRLCRRTKGSRGSSAFAEDDGGEGDESLSMSSGITAHPYLGKPGRSPDTRELGVTRFPYLVIYSVEPGATASEPEQIAIARVLHEAMQWPREDEIG